MSYSTAGYTFLERIDPSEMTDIDKKVFELLENNIPFINEPMFKEQLIYFVETHPNRRRYEIQFFNKSNSKVECVTKFLDNDLKTEIVKQIRSKKLKRINECKNTSI